MRARDGKLVSYGGRFRKLNSGAPSPSSLDPTPGAEQRYEELPVHLAQLRHVSLALAFHGGSAAGRRA